MISAELRFLKKPFFPEAQNLQAPLQPTCEETQTVLRSKELIRTASMNLPSASSKRNLIVS